MSSKPPDILGQHTHTKLGESRELRKPCQAQKPIFVQRTRIKAAARKSEVTVHMQHPTYSHPVLGVIQRTAASNVKQTLHSLQLPAEQAPLSPHGSLSPASRMACSFSQLSGSSRSSMARPYDVQQKANVGMTWMRRVSSGNAGSIAAFALCVLLSAHWLLRARWRLGEGDCGGQLNIRQP